MVQKTLGTTGKCEIAESPMNFGAPSIFVSNVILLLRGTKKLTNIFAAVEQPVMQQVECVELIYLVHPYAFIASTGTICLLYIYVFHYHRPQELVPLITFIFTKFSCVKSIFALFKHLFFSFVDSN
jgi:hypothetical protein